MRKKYDFCVSYNQYLKRGKEKLRVESVKFNGAPSLYSNKNNLVKPIEENKTNKTELPFVYQPAFLGSKLEMHDRRHLRAMKANFTPEAEKIYNHAQALAKKFGSSELELWHLYLASLLALKQYIKECDEGLIKQNDTTRLQLPIQVQRLVPDSEGIFQDDKKRAKVKKVVDKHIKNVKKEYIDNAPKKKKTILPVLSDLPVSKAAIQDMADAYDEAANSLQSNNYLDEYFIMTASMSQDRKLARETISYLTDIKKSLIIDDSRKARKADRLTFYDDKADLIWKNINVGNDTVFLCESGDVETSGHVISSFIGLKDKAGQKYKNIDPEKTDIICLNECATFEFLEILTKELQTDKSREGRTAIVVADFHSLVVNNVDGSGKSQIGTDTLNALANSPDSIKNNSKLHLVFTMSPESYYTNIEKSPILSKVLANYAVQTIPSLTAADARKYLTDDKGLEYVEDGTKRKYSKETIEKAIELSSNDEGHYPDKAIKILSSAAKYYIDNEDITPEDLEKYVTETRSLSDINNSTQSDIVFDTGKRLDDIVGSPMTKADASSIVSQIKSGTIGTKGFRAFLEDGSSYGGGRRHTAEAIAGEAGIPMITIDAKEFALKDIDALSQDADLSEMKIKKIVSSAKAQAEANPNKATMIFIKNFDDFAPNPLYMATSVYQSKAFSQLLTEMENARLNDDVNLIVVGSVNTPELIDPNIMKPYKFLNSIIVYPPQDSDERKQVINYYIDKMNLQIAGDTKEDKERIISDISDTTSGFTVVDIMYLLETVNAVSKERGKEKIDGSDFTEAFLQVISGRPNLARMSDYEKRVVASHEAGHAIALQIMYELAEKQNIPWHLPNKVNFITLDPRGNFGGAMFHKDSDNHEYSFEKVMSDLVCSYGGHSSEKTIYNMSGSLGITADMEHVAGLSRAAVLDMGMGVKTGVCHIPRNALGSPDVSEKKRQDIEEDIDRISNAAKQISDSIIEMYKDFIIEFTDKYSNRVGTGECIIPSEEFIKELNEWREKQPKEKKTDLRGLERQIIDIINRAKEGK